jgi:hypothetical protein
MNTFRVIVLAVSIITSGFLIGGRYQAVPVARADAFGLVYIVDRFTGSAKYCLGIDCREIRDALPPPPVEQQGTPAVP